MFHSPEILIQILNQTLAMLTEILHDFPQFLQKNANDSVSFHDLSCVKWSTKQQYTLILESTLCYFV
jgi:hypothetical protein